MKTRTFVRVIECWLPSSVGSMLEFGGGLFGNATRFRAATEKLCFGRGEGLPGQAWEEGHPIVLHDLEGSYFRRAAAARAEGLTCGIAMPIFVAQKLTAVLVIFCGDDAEHAGAIELWRNDPEVSKDMSLVDGYYGTTGDTFEFISRHTSFRAGTGLPGRAWQDQSPVFLEDLGKGSGFLRADGAIKVGINRGLAIPCSSLDGSSYVMAFLSALATPLANAVDIWLRDASGAPQRVFAFSETPQADATGDEATTEMLTQAVLLAMRSGRPSLAGPSIAIPIAPQGSVTAVMTLHFQPTP